MLQAATATNMAANPHLPPHDAQEPRILRAAAYCRVSTMLEYQEDSYDMQARHYREMIERNPSLTLVNIYGDRGKSGLSIKKREGFQQMLSDCEAGLIDVIYTKSVSRFARNLSDCIDVIHRLKTLGVAVVFERENIRSSDAQCEMLLNIYAALAQEESSSMSQNVIRSYEQHTKEGRPCGRVPYGYFQEKEQLWQINPRQAEHVRKAFAMAAEKKSYTQIVKALNAMERAEGTDVTWRYNRLRYMLTNEAYAGDYYSHKTVCLTMRHQVKNEGYRDRYYIEDHHEAIISREQFETVKRYAEAGILRAADSRWRKEA